MTRLALVAVVALVPLLAAPGACQPLPPPEPPGPATGGATATGGSPGTGGQGTGGNAATGGTTSSGGGEPAPSLEQVVCGHLKQLGCLEGERPTCPDELWRINHLDGRARIDLDCLLFSDTVAQVRACGSIACGGVL